MLIIVVIRSFVLLNYFILISVIHNYFGVLRNHDKADKRTIIFTIITRVIE